MGKRTFRIVLIKPSRYDDDGYVIQWRLSTIPSSSLASLYGLLAACAEEKALGPDVEIEIEACDECNTVINAKGVARRINAAGGGFVGLVGVQSNQFPRAHADPSSKAYVDDATRVSSIEVPENDELVSFFADKIPDTYRPPRRQAARVS